MSFQSTTAFLVTVWFIVLISKEIVEIENGKVNGTSKKTFGTSFIAFYRIPFAKPPLGELRFQAPQPVDNWDDVLALNATKLSILFPTFQHQKIVSIWTCTRGTWPVQNLSLLGSKKAVDILWQNEAFLNKTWLFRSFYIRWPRHRSCYVQLQTWSTWFPRDGHSRSSRQCSNVWSPFEPEGFYWHKYDRQLGDEIVGKVDCFSTTTTFGTESRASNPMSQLRNNVTKTGNQTSKRMQDLHYNLFLIIYSVIATLLLLMVIFFRAFSDPRTIEYSRADSEISSVCDENE
jgi:hypothetical protein